MASHTHFCLLLRNRYWTVGMGVRRFVAEGGRGEGEREGGRKGRREGGREGGEKYQSSTCTCTHEYLYICAVHKATV